MLSGSFEGSFKRYATLKSIILIHLFDAKEETQETIAFFLEQKALVVLYKS